MKILKPLGLLLLWLAGFLLVVVGLRTYDPVLAWLRGPGNVVICVASLAVALDLLRRGGWRCRAWTARLLVLRLLVLLWILPSLAMLYATVAFEVCKRGVLQTEPARAEKLGPHFIVGYTSFSEVARLADKGLIGGIYVTRHNVGSQDGDHRATGAPAGRASAAVDRRRRSGGRHRLASVAALAGAAAAVGARWALAGATRPRRGGIRARPWPVAGSARRQSQFCARARSAAGGGRNLLDVNTLIEQRAIALDPAAVADIARAYVQGLGASGVEATLKHFPGLGRVRGDTHLFDASLDAPRADLEASDWRPFKEVLARSNAALMIGHVSLTAIDSGRPASHSKPVIDGLVRKGWNFDGLIITDDLEMGAIYKHDVCRAVVEALNAGADVLLVAYDGTQFYRIFACAAAADAKGELDAGMLEKSEARLRRFEDALPHTNPSADSVHLVPPQPGFTPVAHR
jgi:beta-N-acetylhexosaminidase